MIHNNLTFIMVIIWLALETCLGFALQTDTITTHWPPKVLKQYINCIQPAPLPFRKLTADSLYSTYKHAESPLRTDRKLFDHTSARVPAAATMDLHNIDINRYAQSLNAELEKAFATVASYAKNHNSNNNNKGYNETLPLAATNNLNVDQSPTGAASTDVDVVSLDWHRYFTMDNDNNSLVELLPENQQQQQHQQQILQSEPTAAAFYQAKRLREMFF